MPFEFLSDEQIARYGRFPEEPSTAELEQFFRLDRSAWDALASKRRPAMKLGWAVQWGTVRMLGVFLTDDPLAVPPEAVAFVAEQLGLDPAHLADYGHRQQTVYEHAWEIRELLDYRDFGSCESEVRQYVAARVWASAEGSRALFDRARVHMLKERILLPGMTVLVRLVGEVRRAENERLHALLSGRLPAETLAALVGLLAVPDGQRRSELERLRTAPTKASGRVLAAFIVAEACNVGLVPIEKPNVPALTRARLQQIDQGYLRAETIAAANARLIGAQAGIGIVQHWVSGHIASADGLRFVVPVASLHAGHNPVCFGRQRGATWLNVVNDQVMGIGGLVVPGTLRDSLFILDAIHNLDGGPRPETIITDTSSYSDLVFGLFAICGYQFSPRIADLADMRLWRTNTRATYGPLEHMSRHVVRLDRIRAHWGDMLRVAGSLTMGTVRAYDLIRMLSADGRPTGLGEAFVHYGRIFKTLHLLQFLHDEGYRRMIGAQLNVQEARHRLARKIAFGNRGQLRQRYREGWKTGLAASVWR
ncbi:hypothetical protein GCM10009525_47670 [Streptosporangium amethystogenes subsp. fukuiense]